MFRILNTYLYIGKSKRPTDWYLTRLDIPTPDLAFQVEVRVLQLLASKALGSIRHLDHSTTPVRLLGILHHLQTP